MATNKSSCKGKSVAHQDQSCTRKRKTRSEGASSCSFGALSTTSAKRSPENVLELDERLSTDFVSIDGGAKSVAEIYRKFKKCTGGADGAIAGLNGSVTASCLTRALQALGVEGKKLVDFGAGDGRVLIAAIAAGAQSALGFELPANQAQKHVFDAVVEMIETCTAVRLSSGDALAHDAGLNLLRERASWRPQDIDHMQALEHSPDCVYTFWVGMPIDTQNRVLSLCASNPAVRAIAVYRDRKWRTPDDVLSALHTHTPAALAPATDPTPDPAEANSAPAPTATAPAGDDDAQRASSDTATAAAETAAAAESGGWRLQEQLAMRMYGSGEQHCAWIFRRP